ncbi:hypothetical protein FACS189421_10020 [Bacteroidia bacterium]|nr:hypothetical protein FACS189421_10020 [Bacteroidia bacterium]
MIPAYLYHQQSFILSLNAYKYQVCFLFYFALLYLRPDTQKLIKPICIIAFLFCSIQLIQQVTYPHYIFYLRGDENNRVAGSIEIRMGMYRYALLGIYIVILAFYYLLCRWLDTNIKKHLYMAVFFFLGIFVYSERITYVFVIFLAIMGLLLFKYKRKPQKNMLFFFVIMLFVAVSWTMISDALQSTKSQQKYSSLQEDQFRSGGYTFFSNYWPHWSTYIWGNGIASNESKYGAELDDLITTNFILRADLGLFGLFNERGILFVLAIFYLYYKLFCSWKYLPKYLKLTLLLMLVNIFVRSSFFHPSGVILFMIVLYLCDVSIAKNKQTTKIRIQQ